VSDAGANPNDAPTQAAADAEAHLVWQGEDDAANEPTAFQAAMAYGADSLSTHTCSPTGFDAADFYLANSTSSSPPANPLSTAFATASIVADVFLSDSSSSDGESNPNASSPQNPISTAFPTASDATDVFLSLSETDSSGSHGGSNANANTVSDSDNTFSPELTTSQIENPLLLVSHCPSIVMWTLVMLMTLGCLALMIWTLRTMNDAHLFHVYTVHELMIITSLLICL